MSEGKAHNPLAQFEIKPLIPIEIGGLNLSFTNSSAFMLLAVLLTIAFFTLAMKRREAIPSRFQLLAEMSYEFISNMVKDNVGEKGKKFFPLVLTIFFFVLLCNLLGMLPYSFTVTSHIAVTFALAMFIFLAVTAVGFIKHGLHFCALFLPKGTPGWMAPLMIFIELFAYLARPISLSVRLAANMMAGHTMLKIIAGFVITLGFLGGWAPLGFLVILTGFEIFVAVLQAYIFAILTCVYLNDAVNMH